MAAKMILPMIEGKNRLIPVKYTKNESNRKNPMAAILLYSFLIARRAICISIAQTAMALVVANECSQPAIYASTYIRVSSAKEWMLTDLRVEEMRNTNEIVPLIPNATLDFLCLMLPLFIRNYFLK